MPLDITNIRKDFPQFGGDAPHSSEGSSDYHYLDTAASSLTPTAVLDAVIEYYTVHRANVHRGLFHEAMTATALYEAARKKVSQFINASPEEIIFTSGATESSNIFVRMIDESLHISEDGKEIVTTVMEHHGAVIPLQQFALRREIPLHVIPLRGTELDYQKGEALITPRTALVSAMLASNVTGEINDIKRIADMTHRHGALLVVDATAAAGHIPVDVKTLECDALYFSGHKMFAPTGVGVLWVRKELLATLHPAVFGGHMIARFEDNKAKWEDIPARFEAGTKNIAGVIGLGAAVDYIAKVGMGEIRAHMQELVVYATARLREVPGVLLISEPDPAKNVGMVSFTCAFAHPHDIAEILARDRVAVRAGHHCAIPLHGALGIESSIRASFHVYNTKEDVDALVAGLMKVKEIFS
jgi:cysteine desulfurase/selenocysteine lyase